DRKDWYIFHSIGIKFSFSPIKSILRASRISTGMTFTLEETKANTEHPSDLADSLSSVEEKSEGGNNYFTCLQINQPYNRDSSYYSFKLLEADVSHLNLQNQKQDNENFITSLEYRLDSLQSVKENMALASPGTGLSEQQLIFLENNIGGVEKQLQDALLKKKEIEDGLITARQSKELYQTAYLLSLERKGQSDSLGFTKDILQLPAAVREALAQPGSFYKVQEDS